MLNERRLIDRFLEYVQIDSPTLFEKDFLERLEKDLVELGCSVEYDNAGAKVGSNGNNLIARLEGKGDKTLLFSSHVDTVSPGRGIKPIEKEDGCIYSDGTTILAADDKAGVAAIIEMLHILKEDNIDHHNLELVFPIYEEGGMFGSKNLDYSLLKAEMGFTLDGGGAPGSLSIQGPSQTDMTFTFKGRAAHAGVAPEKGVSAIMVAAEAIQKMKLLRIDEETTANVGYINGGGPTNVVTDKVVVKAEARSLKEEKLKAQVAHMVECVETTNRKYGFEAEIEINEVYKSYKLEEDSLPCQMVKEACDKLGFTFAPGKTGGGSDINNYNLNGIPSVNLGIGMKNSHTLDEYIAKEDMYGAVKLIVELARIN